MAKDAGGGSEAAMAEDSPADAESLEGKLPALPGETPTTADWSDHATTAFPEVRAKKFLEMRGADGGPWDRLCALPALWVGLLYDQTALDAAWDLVKNWTAEDRANLKAAVPKQALKAKFGKGTVQDLSLEVLKIARAGLNARKAGDLAGSDESGFLSAIGRNSRPTKPGTCAFVPESVNDSVTISVSPCAASRARTRRVVARSGVSSPLEIGASGSATGMAS